MKSIKEKLAASTEKIVTKVIQKGDDFKVIGLGLNKGAVLKEHKAPGRAKLVVVEGKISYITSESTITMSQYDEYDIPLEEYHTVEGLEESICLLIVG